MNDLKMFESLLGCGTVEELHTRTSTITRHMGFDHFLYAVRVNISLTRPYHFVFSGYPKKWRDHYDASGYAGIDPTVQHCVRAVTPIIWDRQIFSGRAAARMRDEAKEFGLANGASFAVHGRHGEAAMLSLSTSCGLPAVRREMIAKLGAGQLMTCYLHEAIQRLVLSQEALPLKKAKLTAREKECLLWVSEGKTGGEIADILKVSERTVTFHLQNAAGKMGVSGRQHALSRALSMGLIMP